MPAVRVAMRKNILICIVFIRQLLFALMVDFCASPESDIFNVIPAASRRTAIDATGLSSCKPYTLGLGGAAFLHV